MNFYVFIGPPGSGKGTLAHLLVSKLNWIQLSTGNLCRKHISQGTEFGKQIDFALKSGKLVSDKLVTSMVADWIRQQDTHAGIILDGYPRTVAQASAFYEMLIHSFSSAQLQIVRLTIADESVIERLYGRAVCTNKECQAVFSLILGSALAPKKSMICDICNQQLERRADDQPETIKERLRTYYLHEKPLIDFYELHGQKIHQVSVDKKLKDVFNDVSALLQVKKI